MLFNFYPYVVEFFLLIQWDAKLQIFLCSVLHGSIQFYFKKLKKEKTQKKKKKKNNASGNKVYLILTSVKEMGEVRMNLVFIAKVNRPSGVNPLEKVNLIWILFPMDLRLRKIISEYPSDL